MSELARRSVLVGSLFLMVLFGTPVAAQSLLQEQLDLPDGEMVLSRTIQRPLADGKLIIVKRSWLVTFTQSGQGVSVTGRQIAVDIQAPEKLAGLAEIEKGRDTNSMYPILLSSDGRILGAGRTDDKDDLSRAVAVATELIERSNSSPDEKAMKIRYLAALQAAGGSVVEELPPDLFYPAAGEHRVLRRVDLPNEQLGEIELIQESRLAEGQKWLAQTTRTIVTRVAGTSQESKEIWTMRPADSPAQ